MDIVPIVTKDDLSKEQIDYLQKQQTEYKLIKKVKRNPGHILFSFNVKTGEIKRASIIHNVSIGLNGLPITRAETVIEPNCYYEQALNEKNFRKKIEEIRIIKKRIIMGFTTPCFIRKNTQELRKKLIELGYKSSRVIDDNEELCLATGLNKYTHITNDMFDSKDPHITWNCAGRIDCGTNEELFLALAALRNDTNNNQWFIAESSLSVSFDDAIGNDHYFVEPKGRFFFWGIEYQNSTIISGNFRKATVDELIEHFKTKEEQ